MLDNGSSVFSEEYCVVTVIGEKVFRECWGFSVVNISCTEMLGNITSLVEDEVGGKAVTVLLCTEGKIQLWVVLNDWEYPFVVEKDGGFDVSGIVDGVVDWWIKDDVLCVVSIIGFHVFLVTIISGL